MPLLSGARLEETFGLPVSDLLALPAPTIDDLELGPDFIDDFFRETPATRRPVITIPGLDDIIHIVPESFLPQEEQDRRRRRRAVAISQSPTPELVRSIGTVLTFIDDVQDGLLTAAVLARLGAVFFPPLAPVAAGLTTAATAINIFGFAGRASATALTGKARASNLTRSILGAQVVRGLRNPVLQRAIPTVGEALQILQTTDQLFGVGVSLGPIVGLVQDLLFGLPQGAEFAFQSGIRYKPGDEVFLRREDQDAAEALALHGPLGRIIAPAGAAAWLLAAGEGVPFDARLDALVFLSLVAELARGFLPESRWEPILTPTLDRERPSTRQLRPKTALEIHRLGIDPHATETFPTEGNPATLSPRAQVERLRVQAPKNTAAWLREAPTPAAGLFAQGLAADLGFRMVRAFEGPSVGFETHAAPIWRAMIDSLELGLIPPATAEESATRRYLETAAALYEGDPGRPIPRRNLEKLHAETFLPAV